MPSTRANTRRARTSASASGGRRWLNSLERKPTTKGSYTSTIEYATAVYGHELVRRLRLADISAFNAKLHQVVVAEVEIDGKNEQRLTGLHWRSPLANSIFSRVRPVLGRKA